MKGIIFALTVRKPFWIKYGVKKIGMTIFTFIGHIQTVRIDKATYFIDHREKCNKKIYFYTIFNFGNQMIVTSGLTLGRTKYFLL